MPSALNIPVAPAALDEALAAYLRLDAVDPDERRLALRSHALPFYHDIGGVLFLRRDGAVLVWDLEGPDELTPMQDIAPNRSLLHAARGYASRAWPTLSGLAPVPGPEALPCTSCDGTGHVPGVTDRHSNIVCSCGGLGWRPAERP